MARVNQLPPVTLDLAYTRRGLGSFGTFNTLNNGWRVGVSSGYPLDRAGASAAAAAADIAVRAAERTIGDAAVAIERDVRRAYRTWRRAAAHIALQQSAATMAHKQVRMAELRFERGLSDTFVLVDAETDAYHAEAALADARIARVVTAAVLGRAVGDLDPSRVLR